MQAEFYDLDQGARLIPLEWLVHLEQASSESPFLADEYMRELRFLPRGFDSAHATEPSQLPVGFAVDKDEKWMGFNCAACHTSQIEYEGKQYRIDGAGTLADLDTFIISLTESLDATLNSDAKLARFTDAVLGSEASRADRDALVKDLHAYLKEREDYNRRNLTDVPYGYARLDAFGRIFNKALHVVNPAPDNFNPPNAPVSIPFLWGTDQSDYVQWVGNAGNANVGTLARNIGEVLGVFAHIEIPDHRKGLHGYPNSAQAFNQVRLENTVRKLTAPEWPEEFPPIDVAMADRGEALYAQHCAKCHNLVNPSDEHRRVVAWMENLDSAGTDRKVAENIDRYRGSTGVLEGRPMKVLGGDKFKAEAPVSLIVENLAVGMLLERKADAALVELEALFQHRGSKDAPKQGNFEANAPLMAYKGRSLSGVWATAPFLHNGSVPSLWQLLQAPSERVRSFYVGSEVFDPREVGLEYRSDAKPSFLLETHDAAGRPIPGNSNAGHAYGTELTTQEKWDLIEYMKTPMAPE